MKKNNSIIPCDVGIIDFIFSTSSVRSTGLCSVFPYCEINEIIESLSGITRLGLNNDQKQKLFALKNQIK